jgi:hypothetical protein
MAEDVEKYLKQFHSLAIDETAVITYTSHLADTDDFETREELLCLIGMLDY